MYNSARVCSLLWIALILAAFVVPAPLGAQSPAAVSPGDSLRSPEALPDHRVVFRIYAPKASEVTITGDWIAQGRGAGGALQKDAQGIWSITVGPLEPDFYSYSFTVDGVRTLDPRNPQVKQGRSSLDNMFEAPGPETAFQDNRRVPHGDVAKVWYYSETVGEMRRMHVYTPPGYGTGTARYPVLYLLHGGGDEDSAWSTVGRAGFILDNLIAAGKAKPMVVVMPNGGVSVPGVSSAVAPEDREKPAALEGRMAALAKEQDAFVQDLLTAIIPYVEKNFRTLTNRENRAMAGLSMGGARTLRVAPQRLDLFSHVGVFSMGLQGGYTQGVPSDFEERNARFLKNAQETNRLLKLFWIGSGSIDRTVLNGPKLLSDMLNRYGIKHVYNETEGGHTWINWRRYLNEFAPLLFR